MYSYSEMWRFWQRGMVTLEAWNVYCDGRLCITSWNGKDVFIRLKGYSNG